MKAGETLVVLYSSCLGELKKFYELLGLKFVEEQDGEGPGYFACDLGGAVLGIYPVENCPVSMNPVTLQPFKLGLVLKVDRELIMELVCEGKIRAFRDGNQFDMKERVLTQDPEGRRVELRFQE